MGKSQIYEAMKDGRFPRPVPILEGGKAVGWLEDEIADYIEQRIAVRDAAAAQQPAAVKRPRGRPRKHPATAEVQA